MGEKVETVYLRLRAQGMGDREAARAAGYASRAPSRLAKLAALIPALVRERRRKASICATYTDQLDDLDKRIKALKVDRDRVASLRGLCILLDDARGD